METKTCKKCGQELPIEMFEKQRAICKLCRAEQRKHWRDTHKEYTAERTKQWRADNSEHVAEYKKQYNAEHKKEIAEYDKRRGKQYRAEHKGEIAAYNKRYYTTHKKEISERKKIYQVKFNEDHPEYNQQYYKQNQESAKERAKQWRENNPERKNINEQKRRTRKRQLPATLTNQQWQIIKDYFNNQCCYCGKELSLVQDHFVPLSKGGGYTHNNIVPACNSCNSSKQDKEFAKWYPKQKFYSQKRERAILKFLGYNKQGEQQPALMI